MSLPNISTRPMPLRRLLLLFFGLPVLFFIAFFWLGIPDSHVWQLALSLILAVAIVAVVLDLTAKMIVSIRWMCASRRADWRLSSSAAPLTDFTSAEDATYTSMGRSPMNEFRGKTRAESPAYVRLPRPWLSACILAAWLVLSHLLLRAAAHINDHAMERAGYWNSKLTAHLRNTLTFDRLIAWQHDLVLFLIWIVVPALLLPFLIETVSRGLRGDVWRAAWHTLSRWQHWLAVIVCSIAMYWLTGKLTGWRSSHTVHGEIISLASRLCLCYALDFLIIALLLAIDSRLLAGQHARRNAVAQPTADLA